jgi:predicted MFS family arabinose efflux permease
LLNAAGCAGLAYSHGVAAYYLAWLCLGVGMRLTLYDAAFATLARLGGVHARGPISQITLLGGLASTAFWPIGHLMADQFGWRHAVLAYAGLALFTALLHLAIPQGRHDDSAGSTQAQQRRPLAGNPRDFLFAGGLYALVTALANFLNAGMSSHMIGILAGLGLAASVSVWIATLRGIGQSAARLCEVLFGRRVEPLLLNSAACLFMPLSFAAGLYSGGFDMAAIAFAFFYGACNGILTITRGTLPLVLFDPRAYGALVGRLVAPSFVLSAAAPLLYAMVIERYGEDAGLYMSIAVAALMLCAALLLQARFKRPSAAGRPAGGSKRPA